MKLGHEKLGKVMESHGILKASKSRNRDPNPNRPELISIPSLSFLKEMLSNNKLNI